MPTFLWSGKDAEGRERSERVEAENAQQAKAILSNRGWTNLELAKDSLGDSEALRIEPAEWVKEGMDEIHTADNEAAYHKGKKVYGFWIQWGRGLKDSIKLLLILAALLGFGIYRHNIWLIVLCSLGLAFVVFLTPVIHFVFSFFARSSRGYSRLNQAKVWGRWDEVLECVEELRRPDSITGAAVPEMELVRARAQALAALGRLDEGVAEFKKYENSPKVEHWLYLSFLAGIYDNGRQFEKSLELRRAAAAENPQASMVWIDLAYGAVRRLNHTAEAREALARAEKLEVSATGKIYFCLLRGIIFWREHKWDEAKQQLQKALAGFQPMAHQDLVVGLLLLTKSYLCAVLGEQGNVSAAKKLFQETEPFLTVHREDELLQACRNGIMSNR
jgi:tetratricopeptide (TPR) repeat protein